MAKDNRTILRGIRILTKETIPGKKRPRLVSTTFKDGMEDELAQHFNQEQLDLMVERGDLVGDWQAMDPVEKAKPERTRVGCKFDPAPPAA